MYFCKLRALYSSTTWSYPTLFVSISLCSLSLSFRVIFLSYSNSNLPVLCVCQPSVLLPPILACCVCVCVSEVRRYGAWCSQGLFHNFFSYLFSRFIITNQLPALCLCLSLFLFFVSFCPCLPVSFSSIRPAICYSSMWPIAVFLL